MVISAASVRPSSARKSTPQVRKLLLRYFPPGLILEYDDRGVRKQTSVDVLDLSVESDPAARLAGFAVATEQTSYTTLKRV